MPFDIQKYVKDEALSRININGTTIDGDSINKLLGENSGKVIQAISTVLGVGIGGFLGGLIGNWLGDWLQGLFNNAWDKTDVIREIEKRNFPSYVQDIITVDNIYAAEKENRDGGNIMSHFQWRIIAFDIGKGYGHRALTSVIEDGDLQELNDTLIYFGDMVIQTENKSVSTVQGKTFSGENHQVFYQVIKAGALRAMNMLASRFEELAGNAWGSNIEITPEPGGGYSIDEGEDEKSNAGLVLAGLLAILGKG